MRILEITRQFAPCVGGLETVALEVSTELQRRGHEVRVVTLNRNLRTGERLMDTDLSQITPIYRLPFVGSRRYPVTSGLLSHIRWADVIHIHGIDFFADFIALTQATRLHNKPFVVTTHGGIFHTPQWRRLKWFYWNTILRITLSRASSVTCNSEHDAVLCRPIVPPHKLVVIPNGVALSTFSSITKERQPSLVVSIGRIVPSKAPDQLIRLFAMVAPSMTEARLIFIGRDEASLVPELRSLAKQLGVSNHITFTGVLPQSDVNVLLSHAHLFASASTYEGFGLTTIEAMASGTPVFVTATGVHADVVKDGLNGWLWSGIPDRNAAKAFSSALSLPHARLDELGSAARQTAQVFDWQCIVPKYEQILLDAHREYKA